MNNTDCIEDLTARRVDTHGDNRVMQSLLEKQGFERRGIIYVAEDNDPRIAYEKGGGSE